MDLIFADENKKDISFFEPYSFDMAFGSDENDFECTVDIQDDCLKAGYYIYSPGSEVGGVVDSVKVETDKEQITYSGRTWHGILENKVFCPAAGNDYLYLSGEANAVLDYCLELFDLKSLFFVSSLNSGITINRYQMGRYAAGYSGIIKMLKENNAKLKLEWIDGKIQIKAVPLVDYTTVDEVNSAQENFTVTKVFKPCNHLICLGKGDLADRAVIHIFTDENGNIQPYSTNESPVQDSDYILDESQKVLFGTDEIVSVYDNSNSDTTTNYILTETQPSDWNKNYKNYYTYDGEDYKSVSDDATPTWIKNTYYRSVEDRYAVLIENGIEKLNDYWAENKCELKFSDDETEYDINDIVGATEIVTGISVKNSIAKKIIKIKEYETTIEYEVN